MRIKGDALVHAAVEQQDAQRADKACHHKADREQHRKNGTDKVPEEMTLMLLFHGMTTSFTATWTAS